MDEALRKLAEFDQHASSVCLFHVVVAFRDRTTGRRVRFARREARNVILGLEGRGPEFRVDVLGAGFLAAPDGRIRTNPHVVEQWREDQ